MIFGDKLKWAIYDPVAESVTHGDLGDAPREAGADDGRGTVVKPFYEPEAEDLLYCKQLSEWWKAIKKKMVEEHGTVAQCVSVTARKATHRIHRLISETDHESEPGGYFDCTVQVTFSPAHPETSYLRAFLNRYYRASKTIMECSASTSLTSPRIQL